MRNNETGIIIYWRVEYKRNIFSSWKVLRSGNAEGKYGSLDYAIAVIEEHNLQNEFDDKVSFKEEFV